MQSSTYKKISEYEIGRFAVLPLIQNHAAPEYPHPHVFFSRRSPPFARVSVQPETMDQCHRPAGIYNIALDGPNWSSEQINHRRINRMQVRGKKVILQSGNGKVPEILFAGAMMVLQCVRAMPKSERDCIYFAQKCRRHFASTFLRNQFLIKYWERGVDMLEIELDHVFLLRAQDLVEDFSLAAPRVFGKLQTLSMSWQSQKNGISWSV